MSSDLIPGLLTFWFLWGPIVLASVRVVGYPAEGLFIPTMNRKQHCFIAFLGGPGCWLGWPLFFLCRYVYRKLGDDRDNLNREAGE